MLDDEKIFNNRCNRRVRCCEAKAILELIGFDGLKHFSTVAGVNHVTAAQVLGSQEQRHHKHHSKLIAINEALHTAFMECRSGLHVSAQKYVCSWAKRWQKDVLKNVLMVESPGRLKDDASLSKDALKQRYTLRKKVKNGVLAAFSALEWK